MSEELTRSGEGLFRPSRRGYDRADVDEYVAQMRAQINELQAQVSSPDVAVRNALERVGGEVAAILQQAHDTADEIVAQGEREASEHRTAAERHAAQITAAAEKRVRELDSDADRIWAERQRLIADAGDLAHRLQAVADLAAERFPEDAAAGDAPTDGLGLVEDRGSEPHSPDAGD